ncbi:unnamed protein product [Lathyrus oleraceus]
MSLEDKVIDRKLHASYGVVHLSFSSHFWLAI